MFCFESTIVVLVGVLLATTIYGVVYVKHLSDELEEYESRHYHRRDLPFPFNLALDDNVNQELRSAPKSRTSGKLYEFWLEIGWIFTMECYTGSEWVSVTYDIDSGKFCRRSGGSASTDNDDKSKSINECDRVWCTRPIITGNGVDRRPVITVNGTFPGPPLVVTSNSEVIVHVQNKLPEDVVTVHFHGITQQNTFYSDGTAGITQCSISPGRNFTHRFRVDAVEGTFWYHGHARTESGDGLWGAFIVLPEVSHELQQDFVVAISDWQKEPYGMALKKKMPNSYDRKEIHVPTHDYVGQLTAASPENYWESALINGKGWLNTGDMRTRLTQLPIERFHVSPESPIRLRFLNTGSAFNFMVHVSGHKMEIVSTDGKEIDPVQAEKLFLSNAERYDVILKPTTPINQSEHQAFVIHVRTLEKYGLAFNDMESRFDEHFTEALLVYKPMATDVAEEQVLKADPCDNLTGKEKCRVVNCFWPSWPGKENTQCITVDQLSSRRSKQTPSEFNVTPQDTHFQEHFLNMLMDIRTSTINGNVFLFPEYPAYLEDNDAVRCEADCGYERICQCFYHINITLGNMIQLVVYSKYSNSTGHHVSMGQTGHPYHMHGHHFYVMKMGWPSYDQDGVINGPNEDISCNHYSCVFADWNPPINGKSLEGLSAQPILKDTVFIPYGGYAVLRFRANNPGWWISHCHMLMHHTEGMAVVFREGDKWQIPTVPRDLDNCLTAWT